MRKDPTEFRKRFAAWKNGEQVYKHGLPAYGGGKGGKRNTKRHDEQQLDSLVTSVNNRSSADFVQRLKDPNRKFIKDWENSDNIATHKMSWATVDNGDAIVFPNVQNINGQLHDFTNPKYGHGEWDALDSAIERGDTLMMSEKQAKLFTENYKNKYPKFPAYKYGLEPYGETDQQKAVREWGKDWKTRITPAARSKVIQKWNATGQKPQSESSEQYTQQRVKEENKRTWLSDAADIAHGIGEGVLSINPYTAIPYFGAKVGQDVLNDNVSWETALNTSVPLFHMAPTPTIPITVKNIANKIKNLINTFNVYKYIPQKGYLKLNKNLKKPTISENIINNLRKKSQTVDKKAINADQSNLYKITNNLGKTTYYPNIEDIEYLEQLPFSDVKNSKKNKTIESLLGSSLDDWIDEFNLIYDNGKRSKETINKMIEQSFRGILKNSKQKSLDIQKALDGRVDTGDFVSNNKNRIINLLQSQQYLKRLYNAGYSESTAKQFIQEQIDRINQIPVATYNTGLYIKVSDNVVHQTNGAAGIYYHSKYPIGILKKSNDVIGHELIHASDEGFGISRSDKYYNKLLAKSREKLPFDENINERNYYEEPTERRARILEPLADALERGYDINDSNQLQDYLLFNNSFGNINVQSIFDNYSTKIQDILDIYKNAFSFMAPIGTGAYLYNKSDTNTQNELRNK